ncbi:MULTISPECIES: hypothetical protein [unclassified Streptomyces]|uniref:hypothetical protein n=1 Tax=unclassified Streptomyces TaxID=2593676 RepID=UPI0032550451
MAGVVGAAVAVYALVRDTAGTSRRGGDVDAGGTGSVAAGGSIGRAVTGDRNCLGSAPPPPGEAGAGAAGAGAAGAGAAGAVRAGGDGSVAAGGHIGDAVTGEDNRS